VTGQQTPPSSRYCLQPIRTGKQPSRADQSDNLPNHPTAVEFVQVCNRHRSMRYKRTTCVQSPPLSAHQRHQGSTSLISPSQLDTETTIPLSYSMSPQFQSEVDYGPGRRLRLRYVVCFESTTAILWDRKKVGLCESPILCSCNIGTFANILPGLHQFNSTPLGST
jgi:hypothetical protein